MGKALTKPMQYALVGVFAASLFTASSYFYYYRSIQVKADGTDGTTSAPPAATTATTATSSTAATPVPVTSPPEASFSANPDALSVASTTTPLATTPATTTATSAPANISPNAPTHAPAASSASATVTPFFMQSRYLILLADSLIVLILLIILTVRVIGRLLAPTNPLDSTNPTNGPQAKSGKAKADKPSTVDDLNIDIPV